MSSLPMQRLRARLLAPERCGDLFGALCVLGLALALVVALALADGAFPYGVSLLIVLALYGVYAAVRTDPRRAFLPRQRTPRRVESRVALLATVIGVSALLVASITPTNRGGVRLAALLLAIVAALTLFAALPMASILRRAPTYLRRPIWPLATALSEEFTPPPGAVYRWQQRARQLLTSLKYTVPLLYVVVLSFLPDQELRLFVVTIGAFTLCVLGLLVSELVAIAAGASPEPVWRARSWFDEHFTKPDNYVFPVPASDGNGARVEANRLWLSRRVGWQVVPLWPRVGREFADGAAEVIVELQTDGAVGVAARISVEHAQTSSFYVGWLASDGRAGIALARDTQASADVEFGPSDPDFDALITLPVGSVEVEPINQLRLLALGHVLRLEINGAVVARVDSAAISLGQWGVFVRSIAHAPVSVAFDTVAIVELERQAASVTPLRHVPAPASSTRPASMG